MTFALNAKEEELLTEVDSYLLTKKEGAFIALTKNESEQALKHLFEVRKNVEISKKFSDQLGSLINKVKSIHPKF
jgi:hypothetical protein